MGHTLNKITLGNNDITQHSMPYIIAEIGVNHEGSMEKAMMLIELAKKGGADAAKFQSYRAETLASKHSPAYWDTSKEPTPSQYELFKKYDSFGEKEYGLLAEHCRKMEIDFISTPFDDSAIEFLYPLVSFYKIASADITNVPLLRKIAHKGKPVVLSTGASTLGEIDTAVHELKNNGCDSIALLHCILNYPTKGQDANLDMICGLQRAYPDMIIGYSDHTVPDEMMLTLITAYLKGARILEKHFTYDKTLPGNDHYHAMDSNDLKCLKENLEKVILLSGTAHKHPLPSEAPSRLHARRSIVLKCAVKKDTVLREDILTCKRPAHGISPLFWDRIVGKKAVKDLPEDYSLQWEDIQ